ncbi:MAG: hypothetical protein Q9204_003929 [Flavoplaca sp. TL-2023a]
MDPLSITASIVATLQAASAAAQVVDHAWRLRHASRDLVILKNEVCLDINASIFADKCKLNDLKCLLFQVRDIVHSQDEQDASSAATIGHHVERLRSHLEQLDGIVSKVTKAQGTAEKDAAVSYRHWVRARHRISFLRSNIMEARNNLSLAINAFLALQNKQMHRMLLHVQTLEVTDTPKIPDERLDISEPEEWVDAPDAQPTASLVSQASVRPTVKIWQSRLLNVDNTGHDQVFHVAGVVGMKTCDYLFALVAYYSHESTRETKAEAHAFINGSNIAERLGFTPLHIAILQSSPEEVRHYLRMDLTNLNAQDNLGRTPLVLASCHSNEQAVRVLMQYGADPNITDRSKRSALHFASQRAVGIVQALMELLDNERRSRLLKTTDERGRTALYFAIEFNRWEILAYLCAQGLPLDSKDSLQRTVLHYVAWTGEAEVMDTLSRQDLSGIDPGALDSYGRTAEQCFIDLRHDVAAETKVKFQRLMTAARG